MRIILFAFLVLALLAVAAVAGPSFVDWNKYKPQIISQIQNATGLKVTIDGDLGLGILPTPHVTVNDITIASPKKIEFENILTMKSADISVQLFPLLKKQVKVDSVKLVKPTVQIEMMPDGTPSWTIDKTTNIEEVVEAPAEQMIEPATTTKNDALDSISLEKLEIEEGTFVYIDHRTKARHTAEDVNLSLKADSLKGPFEADGDLTIDGKKITLDAKTGKMPTGDEAMKIIAEVALDEADASISFDGVASIKEPYEAQGQARMDIGAPDKLAEVFGTASDFNQSIMMEGLLTANQNKIQYDDLKLALGDFVANGKLSVSNLQEKNPLIVNGALQSNSVLNLDKLIPKKSAGNKKTSDDDLVTASKSAPAAASAAIVPQSLSLPMDINANIQANVGGVIFQSQTIKGVTLDLKKNGKAMTANFKATEVPGQARAAGNINIAYASSSVSPGTGQVTYSDPQVTYNVNGQVGDLKTFLNAYAPKADTTAVTKLYNTAQFDLDGSFNGNVINLKESTVKLDQMVLGLGGQYVVPKNGGRAKATLNLTAGEIDFDKIMASQNGGKKSSGAANDNKSSSTSGKKENALKPLQDFSLPLDLTFDISLQKAIINQSALDGLRLKGSMIGKRLALDTASVNNFAGATISAKGLIENISTLTGIDMSLYIKTDNIQKLAQAIKVDTSKLPKDVNVMEAQIKGKGSAENLTFDANVKSMGGQLDVSGTATNLLGTPAYNNLTVGLIHPNLVKAIQVVSPDFKSQAGLAQPINLRTRADISDSQIKLTDMNVKLGSTDFAGNLTISTASEVKSVKGNIKAGEIALDDLLGAKSSGKKSSGGGGGSGSSGAASSSGRWSTAPIDLSWMNTVDVDVDLAANSLTYGAWNFTQPSTALKIGNGQMAINNMKAGIFGGLASLTTEVKAAPMSLTISSNMDNIDLQRLAQALSGSGKLKAAGNVSFDVKANSTGNSANALINALNGSAELNGSNVTLIGFDLVKLARGLATEEKLITSAMSLVNGALSGGQTKFDTLKGDYKITNGLVVIQSMVMDSEEARIDSTGSADLPKWFINVDNKITLKKITDLEPFIVKIKGPIDNPADTFGKNILEDYVQDKIKRKIGKELEGKLPDVLGEDATNALQQFGILPKTNKTAPAPTVVPESDGTTTEPAEETAPAPAPVEEEPTKIEKPEDALNQIIKNRQNGEDPLKGVLKGLF